MQILLSLISKVATLVDDIIEIGNDYVETIGFKTINKDYYDGLKYPEFYEKRADKFNEISKFYENEIICNKLETSFTSINCGKIENEYKDPKCIFTNDSPIYLMDLPEELIVKISGYLINSPQIYSTCSKWNNILTNKENQRQLATVVSYMKFYCIAFPNGFREYRTKKNDKRIDPQEYLDADYSYEFKTNDYGHFKTVCRYNNINDNDYSLTVELHLGHEKFIEDWGEIIKKYIPGLNTDAENMYYEDRTGRDTISTYSNGSELQLINILNDCMSGEIIDIIEDIQNGSNFHCSHFILLADAITGRIIDQDYINKLFQAKYNIVDDKKLYSKYGTKIVDGKIQISRKGISEEIFNHFNENNKIMYGKLGADNVPSWSIN